MYYEKCTKHEAIKKAIEIIGVHTPTTNNTTTIQPNKPMIGRETFLANMFTYFRNAVHNSPPAKDYLQSRTPNRYFLLSLLGVDGTEEKTLL